MKSDRFKSLLVPQFGKKFLIMIIGIFLMGFFLSFLVVVLAGIFLCCSGDDTQALRNTISSLCKVNNDGVFHSCCEKHPPESLALDDSSKSGKVIKCFINGMPISSKKTDSKGEVSFKVPSLAPGRYEVECDYGGDKFFKLIVIKSDSSNPFVNFITHRRFTSFQIVLTISSKIG